MPNDFMALDQNLPRFTGEEDIERRVDMLQDYQYQMLEALRYMMYHLDTRNLNMTEINRYMGTITDPIHARIADAEGNLTQLDITATAIAARVSDAEGNITALQITAQGLASRVEDSEGNISALQQTATAIQQTVDSQAGEISAIRQTANSITLGVTNGETSSTIALYRDGVAVTSQNISFNGMVTFSDLRTQGRTTIYGGNILTDSLYLDSLHGDNIYLYNRYGGIGAEFRIGSASSAADRCELWARALMLGTNGGYIYLDTADTSLQVGGGRVQAGGDLIPSGANRYSCGSYAFPWRDIYSQDGTVSASDRAGKADIDYDMERYSGLFDKLRPCSFRRTNGTSGRRHHGFIAQEVKAAMEAEGLTGQDFAGYVEWEDGCGLRYEELIAMLTYELQKVKKQVAKLPGRQAAAGGQSAKPSKGRPTAWEFEERGAENERTD